MPTIELHGMRKDQATFVTAKIIKALKGDDVAKALVISRIPSEVIDVFEDISPFLRIAITAESAGKYLKTMVPKLGKLGYDIQVFELKKFFPKQK